MGDDLYHTTWNPYHTSKNVSITQGVYHINFSVNIILKLTQMVIEEPRMLINGIFGSLILLSTNILINLFL